LSFVEVNPYYDFHREIVFLVLKMLKRRYFAGLLRKL
jgi:hypothetical protein